MTKYIAIERSNTRPNAKASETFLNVKSKLLPVFIRSATRVKNEIITTSTTNNNKGENRPSGHLKDELDFDVCEFKISV